jgi:asparagine synthase (glutamine-hydrolysing)
VNLAVSTARPWALGANPLGLTELDVATGTVLGRVDASGVDASGADHKRWPETDADPLEALFDEARRLLGRGRCVVAFSGGRDSSAVLAAMLHVARRDGFDDPVAITARWPGDEASDESSWQEHVAHLLDLRRWEILTPGTDFDLVGPLACGLLERHGLLWPAPVVAFHPMVQAAGSGVLVTGEGGDEVFGTWTLAKVWQRLRQTRALRPALRPVAAAALPTRARRRRARASARPYQTWLTPKAFALQQTVLAAERVDVAPLWWPDYLHEVATERGLRLGNTTFEILCSSQGGSFAAPLLSPAFLAALARRGGRLGLGGRTEAMSAVFSPLLDEAVLGRVSKATFGGVFWGPATRHFADKWDGTGLDPRWVDTEALRAAWRAPVPVYGAALPLHAAWLATHA